MNRNTFCICFQEVFHTVTCNDSTITDNRRTGTVSLNFRKNMAGQKNRCTFPVSFPKNIKNSFCISGSNPPVGSSNINRFGRCCKAQTMATFFLLPKDSSSVFRDVSSCRRSQSTFCFSGAVPFPEIGRQLQYLPHFHSLIKGCL